jgi:hypothetical protein
MCYPAVVAAFWAATVVMGPGAAGAKLHKRSHRVQENKGLFRLGRAKRTHRQGISGTASATWNGRISNANVQKQTHFRASPHFNQMTKQSQMIE